MRRFVPCLLLVLLLATPALGHDPGLSSTTAVLDAGSGLLRADVLFHRADLGGRPPPELVLQVDGRRIQATDVELLEAPAEHVRSRFRFEGIAAGPLEIGLADFGGLPRGHRHFLQVADPGGQEISEAVLHGGRRSVGVEPGQGRPATARSFLRFFALGAEHIARGLDHLLFLFVLLIACPAFKDAARIVTAFTLSHSLTLAAGVLGWVHPAPGLVEPLIAGSIVAAALLNLAPAGAERARLGLTFLFGLVHGLGFSSALAELGIGAGASVVLPLSGFNLGVEVGQLAAASIALPLWHRLLGPARRTHIGVPWGSVAAAGAGCYWLAVRAL